LTLGRVGWGFFIASRSLALHSCSPFDRLSRPENIKAAAKVRTCVERVEEFGHDLRRPTSSRLRDKIHETSGAYRQGAPPRPLLLRRPRASRSGCWVHERG